MGLGFNGLYHFTRCLSSERVAHCKGMLKNWHMENSHHWWGLLWEIESKQTSVGKGSVDLLSELHAQADTLGP